MSPGRIAKNFLLVSLLFLLMAGLERSFVAAASSSLCQTMIRVALDEENRRRGELNWDIEQEDLANEWMWDARKKWKEQNCAETEKPGEENCGLANDQNGEPHHKNYYERRKARYQKRIEQSRKNLEKAQAAVARVTRECQPPPAPPPPAPPPAPAPAGQGSSGTPGGGGSSQGATPGSTGPAQGAEACDLEKMKAAFAELNSLYFSGQLEKADALLQQIRARFSHCPGMPERIDHAQGQIGKATGIWEGIDTVIGSCDIARLKSILTRLRLMAATPGGRRRPRIRDLYHAWIERVADAIRWCEIRYPDGKPSPAGGGSTGPGGGSSGGSGGSGGGMTGGGGVLPGCPTTRSYNYAPGAVMVPQPSNPLCGSTCPMVSGWVLSPGVTCIGGSGGPPGVMPRTTQCPPGQHFSRDLQRCHASN